MTKYTLVSLEGQKIENCLEHQATIVSAVFDNMANEDDLFVMEDGFTTSLTPTKDELYYINLQLASSGFEAIIQD